MANRKVRIVRDVKLDGEWTTLSLKNAQKLKIPAAEGRWYITWREGRRIKREQARDHGHAIGLQGKKHAELHAAAFGIRTLVVASAGIGGESKFKETVRQVLPLPLPAATSGSNASARSSAHSIHFPLELSGVVGSPLSTQYF